MTAGLLHLSHADIARQLEELCGRRRDHHLFAFYGTGEPGRVEVKRVGEFEVVPVKSELDLRRALPDLTEADPRVVYLVPWSYDLPLDVSGRFALGGRVRKVARDAQVRRLFGVVELDADVLRSPLVEHLLRPGAVERYVVAESCLTESVMWAAWLHAELGVPTERGLALDTLLGWASVDTRAARFSEAMAAPSASGVRAALLEFLRRALGPAGPLVWSRWERGAQVLDRAVVLEALVDRPEPEAQLWARTIVRKDLGVTRDADVEPVLRGLAASAPLALRYVERTAGVARARGLVRDADQHLDDEALRRAASGSPRLPSAWDARVVALGDALLAAAAAPSVDSVATARRLLAALETHTAYQDPENTTTIARAEMAVRLAAWLADRADRRLEPGLQPYAEVETLGRWYAEEGGFVDRARRVARGALTGRFDAGVHAVVEAADTARTELDRRFARALGAWVESGRPCERVLPIELATSRMVGSFLDENEDRRLLVLLLDGLAWAQAVELLESLGSRALPWGPLGWLGSKAGKLGEGAYPVMLSNLPTVTQVSRSAFFAGALMPAGKDHDTQKDPERWRANVVVKRYSTGRDQPALLLRSESHTKSGAASSEALSLVGDTSRRVVAIVINAIDDALKSNPGIRDAWDVDKIASLGDLLEKARESGRAVLLVGDHGHVRSDRMVSRPASTGGARWRPWAGPADPVAEGELAMPVAAGVWAPKGAAGVVLLSDDTSRYGGGIHAGEHGGASLAEVVTPCVLVGSEDLESAVTPDPGLRVRAAYVPRWWYFEVHTAMAEVAAVSGRPTSKKPKNDAQLALLAPPTPAPAAAPAPPSAPASAFARSAVLGKLVPKERQERVVRAVDFLMARNGIASAAQFASEVGEVPRRVGGYVAALADDLNLDGYAVITFDSAVQQVRLDVGKLKLLFEVKA